MVGTAAQTAASRGVNGPLLSPARSGGVRPRVRGDPVRWEHDVRALVRCDGKADGGPSLTAPNIQLTRERGDELVPEVMGSATAISGDLRFLHTTDLAPSLSRGTQANGLTTTDGGVDRIVLHPVGEIHVSQLLDAGGESLPHRVGLVGVRTQ